MIKLNKIKLNNIKRAASTSRGIGKTRRGTSTDQLARDLTRAMNLEDREEDREAQSEWDRQAQQNVRDFMEEYEDKKAREAADAEFAANLGAMNLAGYKRKTSKKSHKRHSSRKKHRKRRTRRH